MSKLLWRNSVCLEHKWQARDSGLMEPYKALDLTDHRFRGCSPSTVLYTFLECLYLAAGAGGSRACWRCIPETKAKVFMFLLLSCKSKEFLCKILMLCFILIFTPKLRQDVKSICYRMCTWGSIFILLGECKTVEVASFSGEHQE